MNEQELEQEYREFLDNIRQNLQFSVMQYPLDSGLDIVRFKLSVENYAQAALKCTLNDYNAFLETRQVNLYFSGLFRKEDVKGTITLHEILRDARPSHPSMKGFFSKNLNSRFSNTLGLHCGGVIAQKQADGLMLRIMDWNKNKSISGDYFLKGTANYKEFDNRLCKELSLEKSL